MREIPFGSSDIRELFANRGPLMVALIAVVVGMCLLCVFGILLLRDTGVGDIGGAEPTPFPTPVAVGTEDVIIVGISGSTPISLPLNAPVSLQIGGQNFAVKAEPVEENETWEPELGEGTTALWVYGTLINYIIALPDNADNRDLLENLPPGAEIQMTLRDGTRYTFAVTNRETIAADRSDIFGQNTPGITLLLLRARGDERLMVQGDFVVDATAAGASGAAAGNVVELGETAQFGDLRLTVTEATSLFNQGQAPPGFAYFLVDFELQNTGTEPVDLGRLRFTLVDDLGNQYALNPQASQAGTYQPPAGTLAAGETRQATAGYQLPAGLASPTLTWIVTREGGSGEVRVTIPFAGSSEEALSNSVITLQNAEVSADGTGLVLLGQLTNGSNQSLVVNQSDVSLLSDGTVHLMLSTNPAFPWVVPPGQTFPFSLSFQRPAGGEAVFTILNRPYQLSGLR